MGTGRVVLWVEEDGGRGVAGVLSCEEIEAGMSVERFWRYDVS
jgi:hypothetical protein